MSHAPDGEEIVSTPGGTGSATISSAMSHSDVDEIYESAPSPRRIIPFSVGDSDPWSNAGTGATGSTTPTNVIGTASSSSQKKRKSVLTDQQKDAKIKLVTAAFWRTEKLANLRMAGDQQRKKYLHRLVCLDPNIPDGNKIVLSVFAGTLPTRTHSRALIQCANSVSARHVWQKR